MIYSHNSFCTVFWVSSFYLSINIVVLYQFTVTWIENFVSKVEGGLSDGKKGSRLWLCFRVVDDVPEKKGMDLRKRMSSGKWSFTCICGIFFALEPFNDYSLCSVCILPQLAFYSQSAVCILPKILPLVRSLQSAFYTDRTCSSILITWHIFPIFLIFPNSDRTPLCFHRPMHPKGTTLGVLLAGSAGVFIRRANVFARESAMLKLPKRGGSGASQRERGGGGEREYFFFSPLPPTPSFAPSHLP